MAAGVEGERPLSHGTGACAHAARDAVERDAALRLELEDPQVHARPAVGGRDERARLAGVRAGHVGARDARLDAGVDHRRAGGEPGAGRRLDDRVHRTHVDAVAAPRAGSEEGELIRRARRAEVAAGGDALLGAHPHLLEQAAERLAEETAPVARPRVHQKVGPRLTCQRNAKVLSPGAKSRALSQRFTASGTSKRIVQASSFTRWRVITPTPMSYNVVYHRPGGTDGSAAVSTTPASAKTSSPT